MSRASSLANHLIQTQLPTLQQQANATQSSQAAMQAVNAGMKQWLAPQVATASTPEKTVKNTAAKPQRQANKAVSEKKKAQNTQPTTAFRGAITGVRDAEPTTEAQPNTTENNIHHIVAAVANAEEAVRHLPEITKPTKETKPTAPSTPLRADMAGYASNLYAANNVFSLTLSERLGVTNFYRQYESPGIWMQVSTGNIYHRLRNGSTQLSSKNYSIVLGEDREIDYRSKFGFLVGYAQQDTQISSHGETPANAKVKGYSVGTYYAWQEDNAYKSGFYANSWLQYQRFKNHVKTGHNQVNYKASGFTASLETGYHLPLYEYRVDSWERHRISFQPQAQVTWQGVKAKNYIDHTGTTVEGFGHGNIQTKLGAKLWLDSHVSRSKINIKPYAEINLVHNSKDFGAYVNGRRKALAGTKRFVEYKTGIDAKVGNNVQLWATFGQRRSKQAYKENQVQVGFKVTF
ncbi:autotransporter outer membrane beta-barrel domain-containing protein [Pasteurella sp. PK-2025]|uniref:autotransporter family protein n=1 Tax=Pasteurella sp. PK-2025 TaxID=3413133 RepID=UPI003C764461